MKKEYLGDGVYVVIENGMFKVTTEDGIEVTNTIFLELGVYEALLGYAKRVMEDEDELVNCPGCSGRGTVLGAELGKADRTTCPECNGYGFLIHDAEAGKKKTEAKEKQTPPIPVKVRKKLDEDVEIYGNAYAMLTRGEWRRLDPLKVKLDLREKKETADDPCPKCEGTGRKNGTSFPDPCPKCKGTGRA